MVRRSVQTGDANRLHTALGRLTWAVQRWRASSHDCRERAGQKMAIRRPGANGTHGFASGAITVGCATAMAVYNADSQFPVGSVITGGVSLGRILMLRLPKTSITRGET